MGEVVNFQRGPLLIWCGMCGCVLAIAHKNCPRCGYSFGTSRNGLTGVVTKVDHAAGTFTVSAPRESEEL